MPQIPLLNRPLDVGEFFRWGTSYLRKAKVEESWVDVEWILAHVLNQPRTALSLQKRRILRDEEIQKLVELIEKRRQRHPLVYLLGEWDFMGLKMKVTPDVLIPRPETEQLVEEALRLTNSKVAGGGESEALGAEAKAKRRRAPGPAGVGSPTTPGTESEASARMLAPRSGGTSVPEAKRSGAPLNILDVGTGSGCIAIALGKFLPEAKIVATDISQRALQIAQENAKYHGLLGRIQFIRGNLLDPIRRYCFSFDLIISNPPYVACEHWKQLMPEVQAEPKLALLSGEDGLEAIRVLIQRAQSCLKPEGYLLFEIGSTQGKTVKALLRDGGYEDITVLSDLSGLPRVVKSRKTST